MVGEVLPFKSSFLPSGENQNVPGEVTQQVVVFAAEPELYLCSYQLLQDVLCPSHIHHGV